MSISGITISCPITLPISPQRSFYFFKLWLEFSNYTVTLSLCVSSTFKKNAISQYITPRCRIHRWFISQNKCSETSAPNRAKTWNSLLCETDFFIGEGSAGILRSSLWLFVSCRRPTTSVAHRSQIIHLTDSERYHIILSIYNEGVCVYIYDIASNQ